MLSLLLLLLPLPPGEYQQVKLLVHYFVFAGIDRYDGLQWIHWCLGRVQETLMLSKQAFFIEIMTLNNGFFRFYGYFYTMHLTGPFVIFVQNRAEVISYVCDQQNFK